MTSEELTRVSCFAGLSCAALRESAIAHKEIDSIHTAAADLEAAGNLVRDERHDSVGACELFRESAELYRLQGSSHDKAAAMYVKAAEAIGESDIEAGVNLMKQACSIFEEENRGMFHDAVFKKAVIFCVQKEKFGSAQSLLRRQIRIQQQHMNPFEADMYKNCLSIVVRHKSTSSRHTRTAHGARGQREGQRQHRHRHRLQTQHARLCSFLCAVFVSCWLSHCAASHLSTSPVVRLSVLVFVLSGSSSLRWRRGEGAGGAEQVRGAGEVLSQRGVSGGE